MGPNITPGFPTVAEDADDPASFEDLSIELELRANQQFFHHKQHGSGGSIAESGSGGVYYRSTLQGEMFNRLN